MHPTLGNHVFTHYDPIRVSLWMPSEAERRAYGIAHSPLLDAERARSDRPQQIQSTAAARWYAKPNANHKNVREWAVMQGWSEDPPETLYPWDTSYGGNVPGLRPPQRILFHTRRRLEGKDGIPISMLMHPQDGMIESELVGGCDPVLPAYIDQGYMDVWLHIAWPTCSKLVHLEKIYLRMLVPGPYPMWMPVTRTRIGRQVAYAIARYVEHASRDPEWAQRFGPPAAMLSRLSLISVWEMQWEVFVAEIGCSTIC
ncbi:hypothetical protein ONZ51_g3588 [Trametes cubensis]|uniref:Uncharacterized protein n=1 Tax=Trametes cubensis TaxID=1111947 RepID=A0AAD7TZY2_9APHY|nr:hypothetical protein ONZ51_g3588 [Trametes cubensis]